MSRSPLKRKDTVFNHPDPAVASTLQSIRQNPKFAKLLGFSMNALGDLLRKINPKHRNNAKFIIEENGHKNLVQALSDHNKSDAIICASCNCLIKIINSDKYTEEEFSKKIAEEGIVKAIHLTFRNGIEKSPESYAVLLALIRILANSRIVVPDLIDGGLMSDLILIAQDPKISDSISKDALEALLKLANTTRGKAEIAKPEFISSILALIEKKMANEGIVEAGMKIIEAICNTKDGLEILKKDSNAMKIIVPVLQKHPHAKFISDSAVTILPKLSNIEDIERALNAVKSGDLTQIPLLASLLLVDDFLTFVLQKGAIKELITLLCAQENPKKDEQLDLIRNISIALGRICVADDKNVHEIIAQGGLDALAKFLDVENVEVIIALIDTMKRLAINDDCVQKMIEKGVLDKIISKVKTFSTNEKFGESFSHFVASISNFESGRKSLVQGDAILLLFGIVKHFSENKRIQEHGLRALAGLVDENGSITLAKADLVGHLSSVNTKHQDWVRTSLFGIKLLDVVTRYQGAVSSMNKEVILAMVVDILTKQVKVEEVSPNEDSQKQNLLEDLNELAENKSQEKLSVKQEQELRDSSVSILEKIIDVDQVTALKQKIEQLQQDFLKKSDANTIKNLTFQMKILTTVVLIPKIGKYIISEMVPHKVAELTKKIYQQGDLEGKVALIQSLAIFFGNIGHLKDTLDLIREKQVQNAALEAMNNFLDKISEQAIIEIALKSLQSLISGQIIAHNDSFENKQEKGFFSQQYSTINLIDLTLMNIKKYPGGEEVSLNAMRLFNSAVITNSEFISIMSRLGAPNVAATLLDNEYLSNDLGKEVLQFLSYFMNDEEFLNYLLTVDAITSIMSLQAKFRNIKEIVDASTPLLKKLSEISAKEKLKRAESLITDYLERLEKYQNGKTSKQDLSEALVGLLELSLIPEGINFIDDKKGLSIISRTLSKELEKNIDTVVDQGDEEFHESVIEDLLIIQQRLYSNSVVKHALLIDYADDAIISNLILALNTRTKYPNIIRTIMAILNNYIHNESLKEHTIAALHSKDIVPALFRILEVHKEDIEITNSTLHILMILAKESQEITSRLVKKTRNLIRHLDDNPSGIAEADQNMKCLRAIASEKNNAAQVREEGGVDLSVLAMSTRTKEIPQLESIPIGELTLTVTQPSEPVSSGVDSLATLSVELLKNMLWNAEIAEKNFDVKELRHVLTLLDDLSNYRRMHDILEFLENTSESNAIGTYLGENACVDRLMRIANQNSTNKPLLEKIGNILRNLGGNALIPEIVNQLNDFKDGVVSKDPDSIAAYQGACLYLANLFTSKQDTELEGESVDTAISILSSCFDPASCDSQLLGTQLLTIERMTYRDPSISKKISSSPLANILVEKAIPTITVSSENSRIIEILLDTISNLLEEPKVHTLILDGNTGEEIVNKREPTALISSFFTNKGKSIEFLLNIIKKFSKSQNSVDSKNFEKSVKVISILSYYDDLLAQVIVELDGLPAICDLIISSSIKNYTKNQQKLIQLLGNMANSKPGYEALANQGILKALSTSLQDTPFEVLSDPKSQGVQTLNNVLIFFENLLNNDYDHGPILDSNFLKGIMSIFENVKEIASKDLPQLDHISEILNNSFICLQRMSKDPILGRALSKAGGIELGLLYLNKISDAIALNPHEEIDPDKLANLENMPSSASLLDKSAESVLGFFAELAKNSKYAKDIPILNPDSTTYQDLLNFPSSRADSPIISFRMLKVFHCFLLGIGKDTIMQNQEMVSPIGDVSDTMVQIYPKINIINTLSNELKLLISKGTLEEPKEEVVVVQKDLIEELKNDFEKLADHLDDVIKKIIAQQATEKELEDASKLLEFVLDTPIDADSEKLSKLDQYGVSNTISKAIASENPNDQMAIKFLKITNKFIGNQKQLEKLLEDREFAQKLISKIESLESNTDAKKEILRDSIALLNTLALHPNSDSHVDYPETLSAVLTTVTKNSEDLDILVPSLRIVSRIIGANEKLVENFESSEAANILANSVSKFPEDLEKLRIYASCINKTAVSDKMREIYSKNQVVTKLLNANLKFPSDEVLNIESLNAYSKLVTNNIQNSTELINNDGYTYLKLIFTNSKSEQLITAACASVQNVSRNKSGKELLSKFDFISLLIPVFNLYSSAEDGKLAVSSLRIIGNLSTIKENSNLITSSNLINDLAELIKTKSSNADLIKIIICVLINLSSESTGTVATLLLKTKVLNNLIEYFGLPDRKSDETLNFAELLGNLTNTRDTAQAVTDLNGTDLHFNLLKAQEFNPDVVNKLLKNLFNLLTLQKNLEAVFASEKALGILNNLARVHKKANHIMLGLLKIFNRLLDTHEHIKKVFESETLEILVTLMQENSYQLQTIIGFFKIFLKFSIEDECCDLICEKGSMVIINSIQQNIQNEKFVKMGTGLISSLLNVENGVYAILNNKGAELIAAALNYYPSTDTVIMNCCSALSSIIIHTLEVPFKLKELEFPKILSKVYSQEENREKGDLKSEIFTTAQYFYGTSKEKVEEKPVQPVQRKSVLIDPLKVHLVAGTIVKMWSKDGSKKEMHFYASQDLDELLAKKPISTQPEQEFRLKMADIASIFKGYDNDSPFAKPKGWMKKKPNKNFCLTIIGKPGCNTLYVECGMESDCNKWLEYISGLKDQNNA